MEYSENLYIINKFVSSYNFIFAGDNPLNISCIFTIDNILKDQPFLLKIWIYYLRKIDLTYVKNLKNMIIENYYNLIDSFSKDILSKIDNFTLTKDETHIAYNIITEIYPNNIDLINELDISYQNRLQFDTIQEFEDYKKNYNIPPPPPTPLITESYNLYESSFLNINLPPPPPTPVSIKNKGRIIKWIKSYGFIKLDNSSKECYVHISNINVNNVLLNSTVEFDMEWNQKHNRNAAKNVIVITTPKHDIEKNLKKREWITISDDKSKIIKK